MTGNYIFIFIIMNSSIEKDIMIIYNKYNGVKYIFMFLKLFKKSCNVNVFKT